MKKTSLFERIDLSGGKEAWQWHIGDGVPVTNIDTSLLDSILGSPLTYPPTSPLSFGVSGNS